MLNKTTTNHLSIFATDRKGERIFWSSYDNNNGQLLYMTDVNYQFSDRISANRGYQLYTGSNVLLFSKDNSYLFSDL